MVAPVPPPTTPDNPYQAPKTDLVNTGDDAAPGEHVLAGRLTRLGASFIESLIQGVVIILVLVPFFASTGIDGFVYWVETNNFLSSAIMFVLGFFVYTVVNFYLLRKNGQTVGKYLCGIKIVRTDGSPADVWRILFLRYFPLMLLMQIPTVGGFVALIDSVMIFRQSRKCLHDDIADTIVIKA